MNAPLLVAKKLAFQQSHGNRRAIQLHERALTAQTELVYRPGNQFLAGSCLAIDEDCRVGRCNRFNLIENFAKRRVFADDVPKFMLCAYLLFQVSLFFSELRVECLDLFKCQCVFHGHRHLVRDLPQEWEACLIVGGWLLGHEH